MRIIAIDPGYERLGIAVLSRRSLEEQRIEGQGQVKNGPKETLLYSECFKTKAALPFFDRLELVGREVKRVIDEYSPRALSIENLFIDNNQKTAMRVAEVRGAILYQARVSGLEIYEYTPLQIKVAITSYGKASKEQVMTMVRHLVSGAENITQDDEMDAIAIGLTYFAHSRP